MKPLYTAIIYTAGASIDAWGIALFANKHDLAGTACVLASAICTAWGTYRLYLLYSVTKTLQDKYK